MCVSEEKLLPLCGWLIFVPSLCLTFSTGLKSSLLSPMTPTLVVTAERSDSIMTALLPVATSLFFFFVIVVVAALFYPFSISTLSTAIAPPVPLLRYHHSISCPSLYDSPTLLLLLPAPPTKKNLTFLRLSLMLQPNITGFLWLQHRSIRVSVAETHLLNIKLLHLV